MTLKQLQALTEKARRAAQAFRSAAIDADTAIKTYSPSPNRAAHRLRELSELCTAHAIDAVIEQDEIAALANPRKQLPLPR